MKLKLYLISMAFCASSVLASSGFELGDGVSLEESLASAKQKLSKYCKTTKVFDVSNPTYPLAKSKEQHLICSQYIKANTRFNKIAMVFADDKFTQMEAQGVDTQKIAMNLDDKMGNYLGMDIYSKGAHWVDNKNKRFIWIHKDAWHPNLFAWSNPYLDSSQKEKANFGTKIPVLLDFESNITKLRPKFEQECKQTKEDKVEKIWLPNKPAEQIQINCFGYSFAGFDRKFEAVFGDGKLQVLWVLTGKQEEERMRALLIADWGKPEIVNEHWEVFGNGRISLRKDKPEFLILSDEMIPLYRSTLEN